MVRSPICSGAEGSKIFNVEYLTRVLELRIFFGDQLPCPLMPVRGAQGVVELVKLGVDIVVAMGYITYTKTDTVKEKTVCGFDATP